MRLFVLSALLGLFTSPDCICAGLLATNDDSVYGYYLYFESAQYSWNNAKEQCSSKGGSMVVHPYNSLIKSMIREWDIADDVWVTDSRGGCLSFKEECAQYSSSNIGGACLDWKLTPIYADCSAYKRYVLCTSVLTTTPIPTTTTTITTTTPPPTTTPTTTRPPPTTTKRPIVIRGRTVSTQKVLSTTAATGELADSTTPVGQKLNKHVGGMASFMLGLAAAKTDLLGLIIGVVTGTFLILSLVFILCCACQGRNAEHPKRYEVVDQDSLTGDHRNTSNASTNTLEGPYRAASTEESSLEMSDARSHSTKQSDHDVCLSTYPPPPSLYDTPPNVYNILPTVNQHQTRRNPLYNEHYKPVRDSVISEELPLPPPPPPAQHSIDSVPESDSEETCFKGLNPTFKTFLDKTIAVKPLSPQANRHALHSPMRKDSEMKGLITSDL